MAQFYFHCSTGDAIMVDGRGTELDDLSEAHACAVGVARGMIAAASGLDDWRDWLVHVSDEDGEEIFVLPFSFVVGKPH